MGGTIDTEHDGEERTETPGLVAVVALDGTVERLSQTWEVELGRNRSTLVGRPFFELLHRPDLEQLKPLAGADEQVVARFDARVPRFDGSLRLYRWSARLVEGRIGTAPGRQALYVRGEAAEGDDFSLAEALTSRVVGILSPPRE
jgi:PAS domain-containing protein